jgi:hypothetical protein
MLTPTEHAGNLSNNSNSQQSQSATMTNNDVRQSQLQVAQQAVHTEQEQPPSFTYQQMQQLIQQQQKQLETLQASVEAYQRPLSMTDLFDTDIFRPVEGLPVLRGSNVSSGLGQEDEQRQATDGNERQVYTLGDKRTYLNDR